MPTSPAAAPPRVFITGASSGIGEALARHYAARGSALGLVARRGAELSRFAAELGVATRTYACDVREASSLREAATDFIREYGSPDIVIANAGISGGTLTEHTVDTEPFEEIIAVNLIGMMKTFQPFVRAMRDARRGKLVGIASVAGYRGLPGAAAYSSSKAAAIAYLEALRVELRASGIQVITICPGYIATPMTADNPYPMPFLLSASAAAAKIARTIERGTSYAVIPWQMAVVARVLRVLPNWLYDRLLMHAPRKPRRPD
jgi:short-subunit dehydrogenase